MQHQFLQTTPKHSRVDTHLFVQTSHQQIENATVEEKLYALRKQPNTRTLIRRNKILNNYHRFLTVYHMILHSPHMVVAICYTE